MRKKLKNLYRTHTISKNLESIMLMLENKASLDEIGVLIGVNNLCLKDLLNCCSLKDSNKDYQYIHLKMMLEHLNKVKVIRKAILSKFSYSCVLIGSAFCMNILYLVRFDPMIKMMMRDFGMEVSKISLQLSVSYASLVFNLLIAILFILLFIFNQTLPQIFKLIVLKNNSYVKTVVTRLTLSQYKIAYKYFKNHHETIEAIKYIHTNQIIDLMATHIDANIFENNLVFQATDSWMIDPYLSMATLGLETIEIDTLISSYSKLSKKREMFELNKYASIAKFIAFVLVGIVIYVFYTSLMMPLNIMEVL